MLATYFPTCLGELHGDATESDARSLIEGEGASGWTTRRAPAGVTCCGQVAFNAGLWGDARSAAHRAVALLDDKGVPVVVPSGSCATMMRRYYPILMAGTPDADRAVSLADRVVEWCQFMAREDIAVPSQPGQVFLHIGCHQRRGLQAAGDPETLLTRAGTDIVGFSHPDECCGFGGLYGAKSAEVSTAIGDRKLRAWAEGGGLPVVSTDWGCLAQLEGRAAFARTPLLSGHLANWLHRGRLALERRALR